MDTSEKGVFQHPPAPELPEIPGVIEALFGTRKKGNEQHGREENEGKRQGHHEGIKFQNCYDRFVQEHVTL
jgi:hypothetical protein